MRILAAIFISVFALGASAMDRFAALSLIESGDRDTARGQAGEVSRYQIKPAEWRRLTAQTDATAVDRQAALAVARKIMAERWTSFERRHARPPTDFEFYVLWNAPARVDHPPKVVAERAQRFANLVARPDPDK